MLELLRDTGLGYIFGLFSRDESIVLGANSLIWPYPRYEAGAGRRNGVPPNCIVVTDRSKSHRDSQLSNADSAFVEKAEQAEQNCVVGWYGLDDRENPLNWSSTKKVFVCVQIFLLNTFIYLGPSIYSPGIDEITKEFGVSRVVATLGTSLSLLGYALGPMLWSPLSETARIGRNTIYIVTLAAFLLLNLPIVLSSNIATILIFRFLSAFAGSPAQATGGATISDMYVPRDRSYGLGLWELSTWIGPTLGPLVGGFATQAKGWRWTIWELMWVNSAMLIFIFCFLPETSASNVLYRRAKRLRREAGVESIRAASELESLGLTKKDLAYKTLVRPFVLCFQEPICLLLNTYTALITGLLFAWLESLPIVFGGTYGFNLGQIGLAFSGLLVGSVVAYLIFVVWFFAFGSKKFDYDGYCAPEERFIPLMAGCIFIPVCLFVFGWSAKADIPWIVPVIGSGLFSIGGFSLFISILNYLPDAYPEYAASVLAGNNFIRCSFGAGCVLFAGPMYHNLGTAWASTLLAVLGCVFVPVPFLFYFFGNRIRLASKNAVKVSSEPLRSSCSNSSPEVGGDPGSSFTTPQAAVLFKPGSSASYLPQSRAVTHSATSNFSTLNTEAFYEPPTPISSALATPKRAASPVPRRIEREQRDMICSISDGRTPSIKN